MSVTLNKRRSLFSSRRHLPSILPVTVLAIALFTMPVTADEVYTGEPIDLDLADAGLEVVLTHFSEMTGFVFAVGPQTAAQGVLERSVTVLYESTPWDQVVDEILADAGLEWSLEGRVLWIYLPGSGPTGDRNFTGAQIKLRLEDADIREVMKNFSKITGYTMELDPQIEGKVSVRLENLPWDQVLDFILTISGLDYEVEGDTMQVFIKTNAKGRQLFEPGDLEYIEEG